jgi:hypothetical protein
LNQNQWTEMQLAGTAPQPRSVVCSIWDSALIFRSNTLVLALRLSREWQWNLCFWWWERALETRSLRSRVCRVTFRVSPVLSMLTIAYHSEYWQDAFILDTRTGIWTQVPQDAPGEWPTARGWIASTSVLNGVVIHGGFDGTDRLGDLYIYTHTTH